MNARFYFLPVAGALIASAAAGFLFGAAATAEAPEPARPVNVSIIYDQYGEAVDVDLTDSNGEYVPAGSIAESWPDAEETP